MALSTEERAERKRLAAEHRAARKLIRLLKRRKRIEKNRQLRLARTERDRQARLLEPVKHPHIHERKTRRCSLRRWNWTRQNPDKVNAARQRRRVRAHANGVSFTAREWTTLKRQYGNRK